MTDPTITIAGLRAQIDSLIDSIGRANSQCASFCDAIDESRSVAARLTAERDALAAQLAEVRAELAKAPKVCAIHSYALEGPCMTCGAPWPGAEKALRQERIEGMEKMRRISAAVGCPNSVEEVVEAVAAIKSDLASERAHLAACRTRIAGLEQAANERSRTPCNGSCDIALASRQVGPDGIVPRNARECAELWEREAARLWREETRPTARVAVRGAMELAAESFGGSDGAFTGAGFSAAIMSAAGLSGAVDGRLVRAILRGRSDVRDCGGGHYQIVRATTPPAPADVFAGVSEAELVRTYLDAERADGTSNVSPGIRAVLARLRVTLVKPVDPEVVAKAIQGDLHRQDPGGWTTFDDISDGGQAEMVDAVRAALTAAGVPVTPAPEVAK